MQTENTNQLEKSLGLVVALDQIEAEVDSRLKKLTRSVKMQGFRPGKVPFKIVAQQYGSQVRQEVLADAVQKRFSDTVREQNLRVAGHPRIEAMPSSAGAQHLEFSATFEVYPEVAVGDISAAAVERPVVEVTGQDIDKTIEILRKQRAPYEPVERVAAAGDQVEIDYSGTLDGAEFKGGSANGVAVVVGEGRLLADFESQLIGMRIGESKSFELTFPADYHAKEMAGKTVIFTVAVKRVAEPRLPEVDADFARGLGVANGDLAQMRSEIKANLERETNKRVQAMLKERVMQILLEATPLELPIALIGMEIRRLMEQAHKDLQARGMNPKDIQLKPDFFEEQARRRVSLGLILAELMRAQNLQAGAEQVRALVEDFAQSYEHPEEVVNWYYADRARLSEVESLVLENNVVAWALERAAVTDKPTRFDELMGND